MNSSVFMIKKFLKGDCTFFLLKIENEEQNRIKKNSKLNSDQVS
jgi:hypothetical protein